MLDPSEHDTLADALSADDLEAAYRDALEKLNEAEGEIDIAWRDLAEEPEEAEETPDVGQNIGAAAPSAVPILPTLEETEPAAEGASAVQVVEALLFVGGEPLTSSAIAQVIGGRGGAGGVEVLIEGLNERYTRDRRPYRISLGEGGYRMTLTHEYEPVRHRVYGFGPREITLPQDAIEVLALVAYHQPVTQAKLKSVKDGKGASVVRQLVRRELVELDRDGEEPVYKTTPRFLELFGLTDLGELPVADDLHWR